VWCVTTASTVRLKGNEIVVFPSTAKLTKEERKKARKTLSFAFKEYYRGLCLLDSYCRVNLEGFNNVLKKHDKVHRTHTRTRHARHTT
jgi:SPX domain protein involved in polyphosphate accumulation